MSISTSVERKKIGSEDEDILPNTVRCAVPPIDNPLYCAGIDSNRRVTRSASRASSVCGSVPSVKSEDVDDEAELEHIESPIDDSDTDAHYVPKELSESGSDDVPLARLVRRKRRRSNSGGTAPKRPRIRPPRYSGTTRVRAAKLVDRHKEFPRDLLIYVLESFLNNGDDTHVSNQVTVNEADDDEVLSTLLDGADDLNSIGSKLAGSGKAKSQKEGSVNCRNDTARGTYNSTGGPSGDEVSSLATLKHGDLIGEEPQLESHDDNDALPTVMPGFVDPASEAVIASQMVSAIPHPKIAKPQKRWGSGKRKKRCQGLLGESSVIHYEPGVPHHSRYPTSLGLNWCRLRVCEATVYAIYAGERCELLWALRALLPAHPHHLRLLWQVALALCRTAPADPALPLRLLDKFMDITDLEPSTAVMSVFTQLLAAGHHRQAFNSSQTPTNRPRRSLRGARLFNAFQQETLRCFSRLLLAEDALSRRPLLDVLRARAELGCEGLLQAIFQPLLAACQRNSQSNLKLC